MTKRRTALITGASSGIGRELAQIHADKGDDLILVARSSQKMQDLKNEIQSRKEIEITIICKDLAENNAASYIFNILQEKAIVPEYLINNAGLGDFGLFAETDWGKQEQMINVNITALTHLTHLVIPGMISRGSGKILNIASLASFQPGPTMSVYFASKAYVLSFSQALNNELKAYGITVTAFCPGSTDTSFHEVTMGDPALLKERKMDSAKDVALFGYKAMMKGKSVVIYGFKNNLVIFLSRFLSRDFITEKARKIQESKHI